jgi:hypothetical protein
MVTIIFSFILIISNLFFSISFYLLKKSQKEIKIKKLFLKYSKNKKKFLKPINFFFINTFFKYTRNSFDV